MTHGGPDRIGEKVKDTNFESRLIDALQPVRGFALAQGVHHLFVSGLYGALADGPAEVAALAAKFDMRPERLAGFLRYLANEDIVALDGDLAALTARGRGLEEFRPWYELLVGGYAQTFQQITRTLTQDAYADRDGVMVGRGSCGMSRFDALPLVRELLADLPAAPAQIVDIGCGSGDFLVELAGDYPKVSAVGVDPYAPLERAATGLAFHQASAVDYVKALGDGSSAGDEGSSRLFVAAFLLQEILEQEGRAQVVDTVRGILRGGARLAVVEVDHRPADPAVMRHGLGLAYYNPYYFLHTLTEQRLETTRFWLELFEEAGAVVLSHRTVDPRVDSTGLEFGCLLTAR